MLFGCSTANFGPLSRGQPQSPDVNHCILHFRPEGHREPRNKVGSLSLAERLVGIEPGTFQFLVQRLNPLIHSPKISYFERGLSKNIENVNFIFSFKPSPF